MVKPALAANRAVRVLDFLSLHPGQPYSLTEIAHALGVNGASMLSVLAALSEAGYVVRHPAHKTYAIGPALVAVGHAALVQHPVLRAAQDELHLLAEEIEAQCSASVLMGRDLVSVAVAGRPRRVATWAQIGTRVPFTAPFGAPFAAYGSDSLRESWLPPRRRSNDARRRQLEAALAEVRDRGYSAGRERDERERLGRALLAVADEPVNEKLRREVDALLAALSEGFVVVNLDPADVVNVSHVTVPVFAPSGEVVMILTVGGFAKPLAGTAVDQIAARLRASAEVIAAGAYGSATPRPRRSGVVAARSARS